MATYGTREQVLRRTGVGYADLGLEDDDALGTFIDGLLEETTDLLTQLIRKDYTAAGETIPAGLHGIGADLAAESIRSMVASRQTPVVRIDDFAIRTIQTVLLSPDIRRRARLYGKGGMSTITLTNA